MGSRLVMTWISAVWLVAILILCVFGVTGCKFQHVWAASLQARVFGNSFLLVLDWNQAQLWICEFRSSYLETQTRIFSEKALAFGVPVGSSSSWFLFGKWLFFGLAEGRKTLAKTNRLGISCFGAGSLSRDGFLVMLASKQLLTVIVLHRIFDFRFSARGPLAL